VTAAKTAAMPMASYGHPTTGLEWRPSRQPLLDDLPKPTDQKVGGSSPAEHAEHATLDQARYPMTRPSRLRRGCGAS